jgi:hypothetical protein
MFDHKSYVPILRWKQAERFPGKADSPITD